jgi:hypothetical protein
MPEIIDENINHLRTVDQADKAVSFDIGTGWRLWSPPGLIVSRAG